MNLKSPGYRSNLIFTNFDGKVVDRGNYLAVHTLTNPNFFWGNLLIFDRPPQKGDYQEWRELFRKEFTDPRIYHMTFAWDSMVGEIGEVAEFIENGYDLEDNAVLTANKVVRPAKFNEQLEVRPLKSNEWARTIEVQVAGAETDKLSKEEWRGFYTKQSKRYQAMQEAGRGAWFGGFLNEELVGSLGIFHQDGLARYQLVGTHPAYRRQGICGTMVYHSAQHAFQKFGVQKLVMVADPCYYAIDIYESVGFKREVLEHGVCWWDKSRP